MNNKYIVFLILAVLVIAFLWNKNEHADTTTDNITAKNINANGIITASKSIDAGGHIKSTISSPEGGNIFLVNPSKTGSGSTSDWGILNMKAPHAQGLNFLRYNADGKNPGPSVIFNDNGNVNMSNDLAVGGIVTAKKFVSTGDSSSTPLSNEAIQNIASVYNKDNLTATNITVTGALNASTSNLMPRGGIIAWSGNVGNIPDTWALCDGTKGTPDLRGRFILGVGQGSGLTNRNMNDKDGGAEKHQLSIAEMPGHTHGGLPNGWSIDGAGPLTWTSGAIQASNDEWSRTGWEGGNQPHNNMPPFWVLAYIMKI